MILLNPKQHRRPYPDARSAEVMRTTIDFFESKGKTKLLADYYDRVWYADFPRFREGEPHLRDHVHAGG
jgi:acyl-CoA dehydrogenase